MDTIAIVSNIVITVIAVGALAIRIEHRLTEIEMDIKWLKDKVGRGCDGPGCEQVKDVK